MVENVAIIFAASGDIEQTDEYALGTGADRVVEISSDTLAAEDGSNVCAGNLREDGGDWLDSDRSGLRIAKSREHTGTPWET